MSEKKQCVTCSKSGGILICDGCQKTFCGKHVIEHRQELANQLDGIMQEHDLLQQELEQSPSEHSLLKSIDKWEKESITKIQVTAEVARADLRQIIDESKKRLSKACRAIAVNLRSSREADDFSENDLTRWMKQLQELQLEIALSSSAKLTEDKRSVIHLITIRNSDSITNDLAKNKNDSFLKHLPASTIQERFSKVIGSAALDEEGLLAKYTGDGEIYAYVIGQQLYSQGRQTIRFKIEQSWSLYNIFFGCISSQVNPGKTNFSSPFAVGWFGVNEVYQHGYLNNDPEVHGYKSGEIATNDLLHLTFDCEKRQIELFHERTKKRHTIPMDIAKAPFPWQLLLVLTHTNDCVRILSET